MKKNNYCELLIEYRRLHGKTQREFAEEIGISTEHYGKIERGKVRPSFRLLREIEEKYGVCIIPKTYILKENELYIDIICDIWKIINMYPKNKLNYLLGILVNRLCFCNDDNKYECMDNKL